MTTLTVGIHLCNEPQRLRSTLAALHAWTPPSARILLLEGDLSAPAAFNRLLAASDSDLTIFLESGAIVGPRWAEIMAAALAADPGAGLVGPSTNRAWNEQAAFPHARGGRDDVARTAASAWLRFGATARTLEPLYSLGDFCLGVTRATVDAIGGADEGFGRGPCWEMEYSARAARAGLRGLWACGAYVYRSPAGAQRAADEAAHFEASRRRYQDRLCGLRLRGERAADEYEAHCRGDACEHFAPAGLVQMRIELEGQGNRERGTGNGEQGSTAVVPSVPSVPRSPFPVPSPLVSCIMPTRGRPAFVEQSIALFARQSYPARELIIVDEAGAPPPTLPPLPPGAGVRVIHAPPGESIGAKRNRALEAARGPFVAQWDDDDWMAPNRLEAQLAPLLAGRADISALKCGLILDLPAWEFWTLTPALHRRLFLADVHGGTLVYRRALWEQGLRYPARSLAEDAAFLREALRRGARLAALPNDALYHYLRHGSNSWAFRCGEYLDRAGWQRAQEPGWPQEDREFYRGMRGTGGMEGSKGSKGSKGSTAVVPFDPSVPSIPSVPLVSCIMPTADRRAFVPQAIRHFLEQSYPERELIIVDDGRDSVADLIPTELAPDGPTIRYLRLERRRTIGAKRNLAVEQARGSIILHWDDDDWMADWRIAYQVAQLEASGADANGLARLYFYDSERGEAWLYNYPGDQARAGRTWVAGATLCYRRAAWQRAPFPDISVGEDARFVWGGGLRRVETLPNSEWYVARIHQGNTAPKQRCPPWWSRWHGQLPVIGDW